MKTPLLAPGTYTMTQVMEKVIEVIDEEKKRLYMPKIIAFYNHEQVEDHPSRLDASTLPECGTAACVCGWALVVTRRFNHGATKFFDMFDLVLHGSSRLEDDLYKLFFEWEEWKYDGDVRRVPESFSEKQIRIADKKLVELRTLIATHRAEMDTKTVTVEKEVPNEVS